jgi:hypothetical protein
MKLIQEVNRRLVNDEGTNLKVRKCWIGLTKVGTQPANVYYLDYPKMGEFVRVIEYEDVWRIKTMHVDDINEVCIFLSL